ncbi:MAG TPA: hypothetical protein VFM88_08410, partial [Vicinamibacteria bacterium]|nr:hypothetical protein [Vicinamibacteria bacterium]
ARLPSVYAVLPLLMACGFALALYFGLGPADGGFWFPWQRATIAGFATLMASAPTDFLGPYGVPWALTFLLKPNHALGLVLFPLVLRAFANIRGWRSRIVAGLLLHLLAWAFVLHMAYVALGLGVFLLLSLIRRDELRRDAVDTMAVLGLNAAIVGPYVIWLVRAPRVAVPAAAPAEIVTAGAGSPMLLEASLRNGLVFAAALWGARLAWRQGGRLGRLLAAQLAAAMTIWLGYAGFATVGWRPPGPLGEVLEQPDEIFFWLRFVAATCAGIGAWDLASRFASTFRRGLEPQTRATLLGLVCLPWSLPYWWNPAMMDRYFNLSRDPLPEELRSFATFLLRETPPSAVLAGDPWLARYAAALTGRRSLLSMGPPPPLDLERRHAVARMLLTGADLEAVRRNAAEYGITHLVVTPRLLTAWRLRQLREASFDARSDLQRVYASEGPTFRSIRVYRIHAPD